MRLAGVYAAFARHVFGRIVRERANVGADVEQHVARPHVFAEPFDRFRLFAQELFAALERVQRIGVEFVRLAVRGIAHADGGRHALAQIEPIARGRPAQLLRQFL
jgi:hypothetical protein